MTHAEQLIRALRKGWHTTGDMEALRISSCPWKRLAQFPLLLEGEWVERLGSLINEAQKALDDQIAKDLGTDA